MGFFTKAKAALKRMAGGTYFDKALIDELPRSPVYEPIPPTRVNRKDRRAAQHKLRQRTRRTGISNREPARYGWAIHNDANNKALQFINHGLLHSLFGKANVWSKPE